MRSPVDAARGGRARRVPSRSTIAPTALTTVKTATFVVADLAERAALAGRLAVARRPNVLPTVADRPAPRAPSGKTPWPAPPRARPARAPCRGRRSLSRRPKSKTIAPGRVGMFVPADLVVALREHLRRDAGRRLEPVERAAGEADRVHPLEAAELAGRAAAHVGRARRARRAGTGRPCSRSAPPRTRRCRSRSPGQSNRSAARRTTYARTSSRWSFESGTDGFHQEVEPSAPSVEDAPTRTRRDAWPVSCRCGGTASRRSSTTRCAGSSHWENDHPDGAIFHVAYFTDGGINVVDVWESPEQFDPFMEQRLGRGIQQVGAQASRRSSWFDAYAVFNPQALRQGAPPQA